MSISDLSALPAPQLLESVDYESLLGEMRSKLVELDPEFTALLESDPAYKILEVAAYYRVLDRQRVNEAAEAVLIAYATGSDLDQLGANYNLTRQLIKKADDSTFPPTAAVYESDSDFKRRILLAFEGMSVAGPEKAYVAHSLSAHAKVADASAVMDSPGHVVVSVLSRDGKGDASQTILDAVNTALSADDVRPLTDYVQVQSADIVDYAVNATIYADNGPELEPVLNAAKAALQSYASNQQRLGRNIRRSAIISALSVEGVQNVKLVSPDKDIVLTKRQAGYCTGVTLSYGGGDV